MKLFDLDDVAEESTYGILKNSCKELHIATRVYLENLWVIYEPYADNHFREQIRHDFAARFWEMYLACTLIQNNFDIASNNAGPDICLNLNDKKVWIEAIAPKNTASNSRDFVPYKCPLSGGSAQDEKIILRFTNAISEKFEKKYESYLKKKLIGQSDIYVIGINGCQIPSTRIERSPPLIVKTVFPFGQQKVTYDLKGRVKPKWSFEYKPLIKKGSGVEIPTTIFINENYKMLSGILYSTCDAFNGLEPKGNDFIFVHNPFALNPLPVGTFKLGREFVPKINGELINISVTTWKI